MLEYVHLNKQGEKRKTRIVNQSESGVKSNSVETLHCNFDMVRFSCRFEWLSLFYLNVNTAELNEE